MPDSPAQNSIVERLNRTLAEHARAILMDTMTPKFLWEEAIRHIVYIKNRTSTRALEHFKTPYEVFWGRKPDLSHLEIWGSRVWVLDRHLGRDRLASKTQPFTLVSLVDGDVPYDCRPVA